MDTTIVLLFVAVLLFKILRKLILLGGACYLVCKSEYMRKYRVYLCPQGDHQIEAEVKTTLWILPFDLLVIGMVHYLGWINVGPDTLVTVVTSFCMMFVWYEIWFYLTHRLLHTKALYFIHAQHHVSKITTPWTAFSFSYGERFILDSGSMGFAVVVSHCVPVSLVGFGSYFLANNIMNIMLHLNVEVFPVWFAQSAIGRCIFTPTFHALHHARYKNHYGLFTQIPDRLLNTFWPDYEQVQERAANGMGLTSLSERLPVPAKVEARSAMEDDVEESADLEDVADSEDEPKPTAGLLEASRRLSHDPLN